MLKSFFNFTNKLDKNSYINLQMCEVSHISLASFLRYVWCCCYHSFNSYSSSKNGNVISSHLNIIIVFSYILKKQISFGFHMMVTFSWPAFQ